MCVCFFFSSKLVVCCSQSSVRSCKRKKEMMMSSSSRRFFFLYQAQVWRPGGPHVAHVPSRGQKEGRKEGRMQGCDWTSAAPCPLMWRALFCQKKKKNGGSLSHKGIRSAGVSAFKLLAPSYTKCNSKKPKDIDCREQFKYDFLIAINMYALNRSTPLSSLWYYEKNVPSGA